MAPHANGQTSTKSNGNARKAAAAPAEGPGLHNRGATVKTKKEDRELATAVNNHVQALIDTLKVDRPLVGIDLRTFADAVEHMANIVRVRASEWPAP
jgi:hypothetical protein